MADLFEMRIVCKKKEYNRYELLIEECLKMHQKIFHAGQQFKDGHRPIEHCCSKGNKGLKCNTTLMKTNIQGKPKYRNKKGKECTDIESFRNRTKLRKIESKETSKEKKKRYTVPQGQCNMQNKNRLCLPNIQYSFCRMIKETRQHTQG